MSDHMLKKKEKNKMSECTEDNFRVVVYEKYGVYFSIIIPL